MGLKWLFNVRSALCSVYDENEVIREHLQGIVCRYFCKKFTNSQKNPRNKFRMRETNTAETIGKEEERKKVEILELWHLSQHIVSDDEASEC